MATAHIGVVASNEPGWLFDNFRIVPASLAFNHNDAIAPGIRDAGKLVISPIVIEDVTKRNKVVMHEAVLTFITEQVAEFNYVENIYMLSRVLCDAQLRVVGGGADSIGYLTFKNNAAAVSSAATGSASMALKWKFTLNKDICQIEATMNTYLTSKQAAVLSEYDWLLDNSGSAAAANSGGTSYGLTAQAYDASGYGVPGVASVTITNSAGAALFGKCGMDSEITYESQGGAPDTKNRATAQAIMLDWNLVSVDMDKDQIKAFLTDSREDVTVTAADWNGNSYTVTGARLASTLDISEEPGTSNVKVSLKGMCPVNPGGITDVTYLSIGRTVATTWSTALTAGYN